MTGPYLIPETWAVPVVAAMLDCGFDEAETFIAAHQDDDDGLLSAVERESFRRDVALLDCLAERFGV